MACFDLTPEQIIKLNTEMAKKTIIKGKGIIPENVSLIDNIQCISGLTFKQYQCFLSYLHSLVEPDFIETYQFRNRQDKYRYKQIVKKGMSYVKQN